MTGVGLGAGQASPVSAAGCMEDQQQRPVGTMRCFTALQGRCPTLQLAPSGQAAHHGYLPQELAGHHCR